jgi:hypothetical protein
VATVEHLGMAESMLLVRFPGGGRLSIEFTENAGLMRAALEAGLTEVRHPGHPYYFMAPGG